MAQFVLVALFAIVTVSLVGAKESTPTVSLAATKESTPNVSLAGAKESTPLEFGMEMSNQAYKAVCWFENLRVFPHTHSKKYAKCSNGADHIIKEVLEPNPINKRYFEFYPGKEQTWFGERVPALMHKLPSEYSSCKKHLKNPKSAALANESDALDDGGKNYPYKAFAYCLMQTLRDKHGDGAIEDVKKERTHSKKGWMQTLLDRENEFRAHHGVQPLELVKDLADAAQGWADTNAKNCNLFHSTGDARKWKGEATGENLFAGDGGDESGIAAYQAADGWYEEIKDYPFPEGYIGNGEDDDLFHKIGHFTQLVWNQTKSVGYGYSYNPKCGKRKYSGYVVARYFPAGNMQGEYKSNVNQPKHI